MVSTRDVASIGTGLDNSARPVDLSTFRLDTRMRLAYIGFHLLPDSRVSTTKRDLVAFEGLITGEDCTEDSRIGVDT